MQKKHTVNIGGLICLIVTVFLIYLLLIKDKLLSLSISSISVLTSHMTKHWHVLAVGLIPVYLALIIFGAAIVSLYLGSNLQRWIKKLSHKKTKNNA